MTFGALEEGSSIFIDANVFIYHFTGASEQCTALLGRCEARELRGATSALVVAEVCHRLMMIEAVERKLVSGGNLSRKLGRRPELVPQLATYEANVEAIPLMAIDVAPLTAGTLAHGCRVQRRYGFLTNDSLVIATMQQLGVGILASADRGLAAANEIEVAVPTDLA